MKKNKYKRKYKISCFNVQSVEKVTRALKINGFMLFTSPCSLIFSFTY